MKKLLMMIIAAGAMCSYAEKWYEESTQRTWRYTLLSDLTVMLVSDEEEEWDWQCVKPNFGYITIPATVNGYPVSRIGEGAFAQLKSLTGVDIPTGVVAIADAAFNGCSFLDRVVIPSTVTAIGDTAFFYCSRLSDIVIPAKVNRIGENAFAGVLGPITVESANQCYSSQGGLLYDKSKSRLLTCPTAVSGEIVVPDGVVVIDQHAFLGCKNLTSVTLPTGIETINSDTFRECKKIEEFSIPNGVVVLGNDIFRSCTALAELHIPDSVEQIGFGILEGTRVWSDHAPGVVVVDACVLGVKGDCDGSVAIPDGTRVICVGAFVDCNITEITLPSSIRGIGVNAFGFNPIKVIRVDSGDAERMKKMVADTGFDVEGVKFVSSGDEEDPGKHQVLFYATPKSWFAEKPVVEEREVADGAALGPLPTTSMDGYTFDGWWAIDEGWEGGIWSDVYKFQVDANTIVTDDMVICGKWIANTYHINFNANGGSVLPNQIGVTYEGAIPDLPTPIWAEHLFRGWYTVDGKRFPSEVLEGDVEEGYYYSIFSDLTVWACWEAVGTPIATYGPWGEAEAVKNPDKLGPTFLTDMAVEIDGEPAAYGDVVAVFRGDTGALCGLGKVMDDSGTLTVVCYAPKGVTLSFKVWLAESGVEEPIVVECDSASNLVAPEVGSFYEGHEISGSTVNGYTVTFDANGGTASVASRAVENGAEVGELPTATWNGYTFLGWFTAAVGGTQVTAETVVTADVTFYAQWMETSGDGDGDDPDDPIESGDEFNGMVGVRFEVDLVGLLEELGLDPHGKCSAKGLPAGLKIDSRNGLLKGVPTKAGAFSATLTDARKQTASMAFTIAPLPEWGIGTFTGYADYGGAAKMTVAKNGKISGKIVYGGRTWSFSSASYDQESDEDGLVVFAIAKSGKETDEVWFTVHSLGDADAEVGGLQSACAEGGLIDSGVTLWRNVWKDKGAAQYAAKLKGLYTASLSGLCSYGYLSLKADAKGGLKATGKLPDGTSISSSMTLVSGDGLGGDFFAVWTMAPSAYKGGGVAGVLCFDEESPRHVRSGSGGCQWSSYSPTATEEYGAGFFEVLEVDGAYYDSGDDLSRYYETLSLSLEAPDLQVKVKYTDEEWDDRDRPRKVSHTEIDSVGPSICASGTAKVAYGGKLSVPKATKPVRGGEPGEWYYECSPDANPSAMTLSFAKATGIFKGSVTCWYDYISAYDYTKEENCEKYAHTSKKVSFRGIWVQGQPLRGFYLQDMTGSYWKEKSNGDEVEKTYKYKRSCPVELN